MTGRHLKVESEAGNIGRSVNFSKLRQKQNSPSLPSFSSPQVSHACEISLAFV